MSPSVGHSRLHKQIMGHGRNVPVLILTPVHSKIVNWVRGRAVWIHLLLNRRGLPLELWWSSWAPETNSMLLCLRRGAIFFWYSAFLRQLQITEGGRRKQGTKESEQDNRQPASHTHQQQRLNYHIQHTYLLTWAPLSWGTGHRETWTVRPLLSHLSWQAPSLHPSPGNSLQGHHQKFHNLPMEHILM